MLKQRKRLGEREREINIHWLTSEHAQLGVEAETQACALSWN